MDSSPPAMHRVCRIADPDQLEDAVYGTTMRVDRLWPGGSPSRLEQVHSSTGWGLDAAQLNYRLHAEGQLPAGCVALVVILQANGSSLCGVAAEERSVAVLPPGTTVAANVMPGFSYVGATVPMSLWTEAQAMESGIVTERRADHVSLHRLQGEGLAAIERRLKRSLGLLRTREGNTSAVMKDHLAFLAQLLFQNTEHAQPGGRALRSHFRHARRAQDWLHAHVADAMKVTDLCATLGISRRQLEYSFRSAFGLSPHQYLTSLRLNEVRRALLKSQMADLSVTSIAFMYGVSHLSRFAASYRRLFGELPSQTRSPSRARA